MKTVKNYEEFVSEGKTLDKLNRAGVDVKKMKSEKESEAKPEAKEEVKESKEEETEEKE